MSESYKKSKNRKTAPDEQYVFDNAFPVIVDEETWNNAQRLRKTVRRPPKREKTPNRLTGLLFCADCNSKMTHRNTLVQKRWVDDAYVCSSYRQLTRDCTMHYIPTKNMERLILSAIQRISWYVREHETDFIQKVREASTVQQEETVKDSTRQLKQSEKRFAELDTLVKKLYEANAIGKLNDRHFERLMAEYNDEQSALEITMRELQGKINTWSEDELKTDRFIELVKRYEKRKAEAREFTERMKAGLLTPEEAEAHEQKKAHSRAWQKEWRDATAGEASETFTIEDTKKRIRDGLPVSPEELESYNSWRDKKNEYRRELYQRQKDADLPEAVNQ